MGLIGTSWGFHGNFMGPRGEKRDLVLKKICLENQALARGWPKTLENGLDDHKSWTRNLWRGQDNTAMIRII